MKKARKPFVLGKPQKPAKAKIQIIGRKAGGPEKHVVAYTIYADPEKVADVVEKALRTQFR